MSHEAMLAAACAGDGQALDALVRLYHDRVYRYGRSVCASEADADDAVQEAFGSLRETLKGVRRRDALSTWLFSVVRNTCRRMLRPSRTRERLEHLLGVVEAVVTPEEQLHRAQQVAAVQRCLASLSPQSREVLVLRDVEGLSGDDTAARLGVTLEAMKSRVHRARRELKTALEGQGVLH